jgi:hypothetical protein
MILALKNTLTLRFERREVLTEVNVTITLLFSVMLSLFPRNLASFTFVVYKSGVFLK